MQPNITDPQQAQDSVTISRNEYESLKNYAMPYTNLNLQPVPGSQTPGSPAKSSRSDLIWFVLAVFVLISFVFPIASVFFIPVMFFAFLAGKKLLNSRSSSNSTAVKGVMLVFKIIAFIGVGLALLYAGMILLFIIAIGLGGGHMG